MKLGFVSQALPHLPSRGGFRLYGANLIRHLSRRHEIHLVSMLVDDDEEHVDWAKQYCASIRTIRVPRRARLLAPFSALSAHLCGRPLQQRFAMARTLADHWHDWDVIHVEGSYAGGIMPDLPIPKVLSLHDSLTLRCEEMLKCATGLREKAYYTLLALHEPRYARQIYPRFEYCTLVAERDLQDLHNTVPAARLALVPYGIDTDHYAPLQVPKDDGVALFHGHLGYAPNIDATLEFANKILPLIKPNLPTLTFHIVAADPVQEIRALASRPEVALTISPPDVRPAMSAARIYVCPMRHGTGMKNKILEAMAMQLPIVCYAPAVSGIDCTPGTHVLVADNPADFARNVIQLFRDPAYADRLGRAGRSLVEDRYSWELRAQTYEDLYARAIARRQELTRTRVREPLQEATQR